MTTIAAYFIIAWFVYDLLPGSQWYKGPKRDPDWRKPGMYITIAGNIAVAYLVWTTLT